MRAKTRVMVVSAAAGLVVIPLTGAATTALVGGTPVTPNLETVALNDAQYAEQLQEIGAPVVADGEATFEFSVPDLEVKPDPEPAPAPRRSTSSSSSARPVANSASVSQAIAGSSIIAEASKYVGAPYVSGGSSPSGFDCSGFVSYVYGKFGVSLPRTSGSYYNIGTRVSSPQPGDIIVSPGHVGIYAGPNLQIDAPRPGKTVQFRAIWQSNPVYIRVS